MAKQLTFDLGIRSAQGREDFLVAPSNQAAVALIDQWPNWPAHAAVLAGPEGSGKSHLVQVWCMTAGADVVPAREITTENVPELFKRQRLAVEDVSAGAFDETALFHLLNLARQEQGHILLTSSSWPPTPVRLPDLLTRLSALPVARILAPDDDLLRGVLVKLFADRQINVDEGLITYLVTRMPRSLDAASLLVARIDQTALESRAEITKTFAGKILSELESPELF